jgi:hypothetical protein
MDVCHVYGRCIGIDCKTDNGGDIVDGILHYHFTQLENHSAHICLRGKKQYSYFFSFCGISSDKLNG